MATTKFKVPNVGQALIAYAVGLDPNAVVVRTEDDKNICFLHSKTREEIVIDKTTGKMVVC